MSRRDRYILVELAGLRAEIIGHQAARYSVDQLGLAAIVAIYAWILGTKSAGVLILPPVIALVAFMRQVSIAYSIRKIAAYIALREVEVARGGWECWLKETGAPKSITLVSNTVWIGVLILTVGVAVVQFRVFDLIGFLVPAEPPP